MYKILITSFIVIFTTGCNTNPTVTDDMELNSIHKLAADGNFRAQHRLCYGYSYGEEGLRKDEAKAFRWCELAAESGAPSSVTLYAEKYYFGIGTPKNLKAAYPLYKQAAEKGHSHAQYILSQFYILGYLGERNIEQGMGWLLESASQGHEGALELLQKIKNEIEPKRT